MLCFLFEYAATLGLIDVAFVNPEIPRHNDLPFGLDLPFSSRYDGLLYFRVTALGDFCLGTTTTYARSKMPSGAQLSVKPNLKIELTQGKLTIAESLTIETFADSIGDGVWEVSD